MKFRRSTSLVAVLATITSALLACGTEVDDSESAEQGATSSDWARERDTQQAKVDRYLAQNAVDFDWFKDSPIGFNGVPYVLLRVLVEEYPDVWPADFLGFAGHPDDYGTDGRLKPAAQRKHKLPYGFGFKDVGMDPNATTENVFFSCGACHTGRVVVDGKVKHIYGAPNTEVDAQMYTALLMQTAGKLFDLRAQPQPTPNVAEITKVFTKLAQKAQQDPAWFYGPSEVAKAQKQVQLVLAGKDKILEGLAGSAAKANPMYNTLPGLSGSYSPRDGRNAPKNFGPRPGQMDAYGIASGLVFLHSKRPDLSFFANLPEDHPYFDGLDKTQPKEELYKQAAQRLQATAAEWLPKDPAPVDIKSLFLLGDRHHAGWDGNQGADARVVASGTSAVADPTKVNLPIHAGMNDFLNGLPAAPYPFDLDERNVALARGRGKTVFEENCASCHKPQNQKIYTIAELGGVDANRALLVSPTARLGLIALMRETCKDQWWCTPAGNRAAQDNEYLREVRTPDKAGYKADALHGIWSQAPYLHNGSVPTLWHLLYPSQRPQRFFRGNINFDQEKVGFVWDERPRPGSYDNVRVFEYDTTLRGQSNAGHTFGSDLSDRDKLALLQYLKTL